MDGDGNIIVADQGNHRIRKIGSDAIVSTIAGIGIAGFADGPGAQARFQNPSEVAVDGEGFNLAAASRLDPPKAVYITPSHQFPTGVRMSLARRMALLDYARHHDAWILEDDYDHHFQKFLIDL